MMSGNRDNVSNATGTEPATKTNRTKLRFSMHANDNDNCDDETVDMSQAADEENASVNAVDSSGEQRSDLNVADGDDDDNQMEFKFSEPIMSSMCLLF